MAFFLMLAQELNFAHKNCPFSVARREKAV
jgi:hypothetical protein